MNGSKGRGLGWRTRKEADETTQTGCLRTGQGPNSEGLQGHNDVGLVVGWEVREAGEPKVLPLSALVAWRSQWAVINRTTPGERRMADAWNTDAHSLA